MRLLVYDTEMQTANGYLPRAIVKAASKLIGHDNVQLASHANVVELAKSNDWQALLAIGGAGADKHILAALAETGIHRVLWSTEDPYERRLVEIAEPAFHHVFTNEKNCHLATPNTSYLPLAAEPSIHYREILKNDNEYSYDLTFVGTAWPNRVKSLRNILSKLPSHLRLHLRLPWNRHIPEPKLPGFGVLPQLRLEINDLCDIWNSSRVVLTIGREFTNAGFESNQSRGSSPPPRIYETALAGGYQVALKGAGMGLEKTYGERIPIAEDETEAAELILQALSNAETRIIQAKESQQYTLRSHTYSERLIHVLRVFKKLEQFQQGKIISFPERHPSILHIAHNAVDLGLRQPGGTESYVNAISLEQQRRNPNRSVYTLAPKAADRLALIKYDAGRASLIESFYVGRISEFASSNKACEQILCDIISTHGIGIVHVHHLIGLPLSLPIIAKALGCKVVITLHDFYLACHRYTLLNSESRFCEIHKQYEPEVSCRLCLQGAGLRGDERNRRLEVTRIIMASSDIVLASTSASAHIMTEIYPEIASKTIILEMITPMANMLRTSSKNISNRNQSIFLQVGVIGNAVPQKGLATLVKVLKYARALPIRFHILGATTELDRALNEAGLQCDNLPIVNYIGPYDRKELLTCLKTVDTALFLSTWPETYHISLGEAMIHGVVPIATNIGAHSDRIEGGKNGILVDPDDSRMVIQSLIKLQSDRNILNNMSRCAASVSLVTEEGHVDQLESIYESTSPWRGIRLNESKIDLTGKIDLGALGIRLTNDQWNNPDVRWDAAL
jgi:glycosyltransferase involved in cell wall biosynthesis/spore maturation protein CgeB